MITLPRCGNGWKSTVNVAFGQEFEGGKTNQNEDPGDKTCSFFEPFLTTCVVCSTCYHHADHS